MKEIKTIGTQYSDQIRFLYKKDMYTAYIVAGNYHYTLTIEQNEKTIKQIELNQAIILTPQYILAKI